MTVFEICFNIFYARCRMYMTVKILNCGFFMEMDTILGNQPSAFVIRLDAGPTWSTSSDEEPPV